MPFGEPAFDAREREWNRELDDRVSRIDDVLLELLRAQGARAKRDRDGHDHCRTHASPAEVSRLSNAARVAMVTTSYGAASRSRVTTRRPPSRCRSSLRMAMPSDFRIQYAKPPPEYATSNFQQSKRPAGTCTSSSPVTRRVTERITSF